MKNVSGKLGPRMHWYFLGLCLACEYLRQSQQFRINFSSWLFKPVQYTVSTAFSLHLPVPKCPSWMNLSVTSHFLCGTTIWIPFKTIPSSMVSSSLKVQYSCSLTWHSSHGVLGHPMHNGILEECKLIIFLGCNSHLIQAATSGT